MRPASPQRPPGPPAHPTPACADPADVPPAQPPRATPRSPCPSSSPSAGPPPRQPETPHPHRSAFLPSPPPRTRISRGQSVRYTTGTLSQRHAAAPSPPAMSDSQRHSAPTWRVAADETGSATARRAGLGEPTEHALISLLALTGLRVCGATGADIQVLGLERGHRTLKITRIGGKIVTIPLASRTASAI